MTLTAAELSAAIAALLIAILNILGLFGLVPVLDPITRTILVNGVSAVLALIVVAITGRRPARVALRALTGGPPSNATKAR